MCMVNVLPCRYSIAKTRKTLSFRQAAATYLKLLRPGNKNVHTKNVVEERVDPANKKTIPPKTSIIALRQAFLFWYFRRSDGLFSLTLP